MLYWILTGSYDPISLGNAELNKVIQVLLVQAFLRPLIYINQISMRKIQYAALPKSIYQWNPFFTEYFMEPVLPEHNRKTKNKKKKAVVHIHNGVLLSH